MSAILFYASGVASMTKFCLKGLTISSLLLLMLTDSAGGRRRFEGKVHLKKTNLAEDARTAAQAVSNIQTLKWKS